MGMQMAKVPQEEPVAKAIMEAMIKMIAGSSAGDKNPSLMEII